MSIHKISNKRLTIKDVSDIIYHKKKIALSVESRNSVENCYNFLKEKLSKSSEPIYGVNTGFGSLCNISISSKELSQLQQNLVRSHACGTGEILQDEIVKIMLLLKIQSLSYGHSGVKIETLERLIHFFNRDILPVIYTKGSLGASGDLAPLAHLSLPLLGEGEVKFKDKIYSTKEILSKEGLKPLQLEAKEGLALLNGTQFMTAYGCYLINISRELLHTVNMVSALSLDAFYCKTEPFNSNIHRIRNSIGQQTVAKEILHYLKDSEISATPKNSVQDPYSFRCIPQVHGATLEALDHVQSTFEHEINAVTDNPSIFPEEGLILSGGNFHGQRLALTMDYLCMAISELSSISERRTYQLLSGQRGLPAFLIADPGLNSGLMIPQYTAASIVSENKHLSNPAVTDSIPSSNGQEDHVSMGANSAVKLMKVVENTTTVIAIEMFTASQALYFREPLKTGRRLNEILNKFRKKTPTVINDRILYTDIREATNFIREIGK